MNAETNRPGALLMLASSMLIFGTIGLFRRYIPLSSGLLAFSRGILGALFLGLFLMIRRLPEQRLKKRKGSWNRTSAPVFFLLILSGALIGVNWILLFEAYNYTTVATATLCYYMQPTIVILLSPLFFYESLTAKKLVCAFLAVFGMPCFLHHSRFKSEYNISEVRCGIKTAHADQSVRCNRPLSPFSDRHRGSDTSRP